MKKVKLENGAYKLVADEGKLLVIEDAEGNRSYTSEVLIPSGSTLNEWGECLPEPITAPTEEEIKQQRIAALKAELAKLEDTSTVSITE